MFEGICQLANGIKNIYFYIPFLHPIYIKPKNVWCVFFRVVFKNLFDAGEGCVRYMQ